MSVVVAYYQDAGKASEILRSLARLQETTSIEIGDVALMRKTHAGNRLELAETAEVSQGSEACGLLGALFPPAILALDSVGVTASVAQAHFREQGFDSNILKEIGENMPPGGAAVVAVIEERWFAELKETIAGHEDIARFGMNADASPASVRRYSRQG